MAGANNRQLKAAGFKPAAIKVIRSTGGRGLSLRSAISTAQGHGLAVPAKAVERAGTEGAPEGWKRAARGEKPAQSAAASEASEANAKARQEARAVYEKGNAASGGKLAEMRSNIRGLIGKVRAAEKAHTMASANAGVEAGKAMGPMPKGGKKLDAYFAQKDALAAKNPALQRAKAERAAVRAELASALASRNATATSRAKTRQAEAAGQMDLFGAPAPRQPSPFERRIALRDARRKDVFNQLGRDILARRKRDAAEIRTAQKEASIRETGRFQEALVARMKQAAADRQAAAVKRVAPGLRLAGASMMAARRQQASRNAEAAGAAERARTAATAAAIDRNAGASRIGKYKIEKNVTIMSTVRGADGNPTKAPFKAIVKAGDMAVVKADSGKTYNVTHVPSGYIFNSGLSKNVAIGMVQGMASGRGALAINNYAFRPRGEGNSSAKAARTERAALRYKQIVNKRQAAYELQSARESHARAVQGGNPTVIKTASSRLSDAERWHKSANEHANKMRRRG